jgi:hypothetical protein
VGSGAKGGGRRLTCFLADRDVVVFLCQGDPAPLLKEILVQEARSKMTGGAASTAAKKRRVEFKDPGLTPSPAKMQSPVPNRDGNAASLAVVGAGNAAAGSAERA